MGCQDICKNNEHTLIAGGVVLFNPDIRRLSENIDAVISQVDVLVLVDNCSDNINLVEQMISDKYSEKVFMIKNSKNEGIAKALNQIVEYSYENNYEWVLTLDQDSIYPIDGIKECRKYMSFEKVGIVAPSVLNRGVAPKTYESEYEYIPKCITSGSLTNVKICREVGLFNEDLFIDYVDFDLCIRLIINGYKIICVNTINLLQDLGKIQKVKLLNITLNTFNHSPSRNYFYVRNKIFYIRKYGNYISRMEEIKDLFLWEIKKFLFEKDKLKKFTSALRGLKDGLKMKIK